MITILDESTPVMTSAVNPGSETLSAAVTSSGENPPAPCSSTESTPVMTPDAHLGSDRLGVGVSISSEDNLPVPGSSTESTPAMVSRADNFPAAVASSGDNPPASSSSTLSTCVMTSAVDPGSSNIPAGGSSSGGCLPAQCCDSKTTNMRSDSEQALAYFEEDDSHEASKSHTDYLTWANRKLKEALNAAKKKVSDQFLKVLCKLFEKTKVILVVGQTGTGKTSVLKSLTGSEDLKPAGTMSSGTNSYEIHTAIVNHEQFLFVDTAGFGAADLEDKDNFHNIAACITALGPFTTISGIIFVYGYPQRLHEHDLRTIQWLQCFCGPEFFRNITVVTTKWDIFSKDGFVEPWGRIKELENELSLILCPDSDHPGGILYHHGLEGGKGDPDASIAYSRVLSQVSQGEDRARALRNHVERRYCNSPPKQLQFLRELQEGKEIEGTEAWKPLMHSVYKNKVVIKNDRAVVVEKTTGARGSEGGKASSTPSQEKTNNTGGQSEEKAKAAHGVPSPQTKADAESSDNESGPSHGERVGSWLWFLYEVANGFSGARTQSRTGAGPEPSPEASWTWASWFSSWFK